MVLGLKELIYPEFFLFGDRRRFAITRASCLTFVVMCLRWSQKSSMGLICTPSILYYLFKGRYFMFMSSSNLIVLIWFIIRFMLALLNGFPYPQSAHVGSHLVVSSSSLVYLLKRCSLFTCVWRFSRVTLLMLMSSA